MIEKKIHYCWFGGKPLPPLAEKCIESWKKFMPGWEIVRWDESNFDVNAITYTKEAYEAKKYAFVSDYARFEILYKEGGLYFDTDVEIIKDLSPIVEKGAFYGLEGPALVNAGLGMGCEKGNAFAKEVLDSYQNDHFILADGKINLNTVVTRVSNLLKAYGMTDKDEIQTVKDFTVYPIRYFCPKDTKSAIITITDDTYTIHHYDGSWTTDAQKLFEKRRAKLYKKLPSSIAKLLSVFPFCAWQITDNGWGGFMKKVAGKIFK